MLAYVSSSVACTNNDSRPPGPVHYLYIPENNRFHRHFFYNTTSTRFLQKHKFDTSSLIPSLTAVCSSNLNAADCWLRCPVLCYLSDIVTHSNPRHRAGSDYITCCVPSNRMLHFVIGCNPWKGSYDCLLNIILKEEEEKGSARHRH